MKTRTIANMLATAVFAACATASFALESFVLDKDKTATLDDAILIRSVYAVNQDSGNNANESAAAVSTKIETTYYKHIPQLVPFSGGDIKAYRWFDLQIWYGPQYVPSGYVLVRMNRVTKYDDENFPTYYPDPYLYEGEAYGVYTNRMFDAGTVKSDGTAYVNNIGPVSSSNDIYIATNTIYTKVRAYTQESNQTMYIECFVTNLLGSSLPSVNTNTSPMKSYFNATMSYNVNSRFVNIYSFTNTVFSSDVNNDVSFRGYADPDAKFTMSALGSKDIPYNKTETIQIASIAPGTSSFAITNHVDYMLPPKFILKATTTQPRTKIGVIYEK